MSKFLDTIKERAKKDKKTIVLPESMDARTFEAAEKILKEDIANLVIIGTPQEIEKYGKGFDISGEALVVENHAQQEGQGSHQHIHRDNHPEPGPILDLTCEFAYRNGAEELGGEQGQEFADGIVGAGTPDVRGVLVANAEEVIPVPQGDEAQLRLKDLIEHNKQHQKQQSRRRI